MKRSRRLLTLGILIVMLSTIPVLAVLQYRWLGEVAEAERREMLASLQRALFAVRGDLAGELSALREIFSVGLGRVADWTVVAERLSFWRETTRFPGLVGAVYAMESGAGASTFYEVASTVKRVDAADVPEWFRRYRLLLTQDRSIEELRRLTRSSQAVGRIILPIAGPAAEVRRAVAVGLDVEYLTDVVLKTIVRDRFGGDQRPVAVSITDSRTDSLLFSTTGTPVAQPDISARFYPTVHTRLLSASLGGIPALRSPDIVSWVFRSSPADNSEREEWRAFIAEVDPPEWRFDVAYTAGSLSEIVRRNRRRNMSITAGVLAVLALALITLYSLWRRAESLADRERMFVAGVSHEIRTPLAAVYSAGENLSEGIVTDDAQVRRYGALIRNEGSRLRSMVEEILLFARLKASGRALDSEPIRLATVLEESVAAARRNASSGEQSVQTAFPDPDATVEGNRAALRLVFENVVSNALKHNDRGTRVTVRAYSIGRAIRVTVADDGEGMSRRDLRRVMNPFYRGTRAVADQLPGSGLGLALAAQVVRYHGGRLRMQSVQHHGTTVSIELPVGRIAPRASRGAT